MNVIVLMGAASDHGDVLTDNLKEINRTTILEHSFNTFKEIDGAHFIFVIRKDDISKCHLDNIIKLLDPSAEIITMNGNTKGAVCSALLAIDCMNPDEPLVIVGVNQIVLEPYQDAINDFKDRGLDAGTIVFEDIHPRWSFMKIDELTGNVIEAAEKNPISKNASTGFYYFSKAEDFIVSSKSMILKKAQINGKFYLSLCLNEMILKQKKIGVYHIDKNRYFNLNNLEGIEAYTRYLEGR